MIRRGAQLACMVGLLASSPASAQDPSEADKATARSLVFAGDTAFAEGDFTRALARYSAAYRLVRVPTVGIEVARTEAALGQLQRARQSAQEVVGLPQKAPEPPVVERARADASRLAAELGERIPSLTLELPPAIAGVQIRIDGVDAPSTPPRRLSLDPGRRRVSVSAIGFRPVEQVVELAEREQRALVLQLEPLPGAPSLTGADAALTRAGADAALSLPATSQPELPGDSRADAGSADIARAAPWQPRNRLKLDVELASAYLWRGQNLFRDQKISDQALSVFPSATASVGAFSLGYLGVSQLSGDNRSAVVDAAAGAEQRLTAGYRGSLADDLGYAAELTYWVYPFAKGDAAWSMYIEPGAAISYAAGADWGLYVGYFRGLQELTRPLSFVYLNPSVGKRLPITTEAELDLELSAGYKIPTNETQYSLVGPDVDVTLDLGLKVWFSNLYLTPQVHAAFVWSEDVDEALKDQVAAWAGVHVGYDIDL